MPGIERKHDPFRFGHQSLRRSEFLLFLKAFLSFSYVFVWKVKELCGERRHAGADDEWKDGRLEMVWKTRAGTARGTTLPNIQYTPVLQRVNSF